MVYFKTNNQMKTTENTILITGGGSGIGLAFAKKLAQEGNQIILVGRTENKLIEASKQIPDAQYLVADLTKASDVEELTTQVKSDFPTLNLLINNAGTAYAYSLLNENSKAVDKASVEFETNFLSVVRLTEALLPVLKQNANAAIVNVSSLVSFIPSISLPTYSASKAALHSYTQVLRAELKNQGIQVYEVMPPLVNTELSHEIGGADKGIPPEVVAEDLLKALTEEQFEVRVGLTNSLYQLYLQSPEQAFSALNSSL
jgi:uncharacterized oxidoreductase